MTPPTLGPYRILEKLGEGGMGEVYRARDTRLGREVAIKVLPADRVVDERRRRRFLHEAQALSTISHSHIVTIHELESADDVDFIVMEHVRGTTLDTHIPAHGLRLPELLRIAIPVAEALAAAHAHGIVHRDLKPGNIMVGDDGAVKVLDFGLAKLTESEADEGRAETASDAGRHQLSAAGRIVGTAAYMSPEQASGGQADARSDVFSFGATLYEMATGRRAFDGRSTAETLAAVLREQPAPPSQIAAGLPRELERLILRCLRKEPDRRYQSMLDVRNELQEIKDESQPGPARAPAQVRPRRRAAVGVALSAALLLAAAASWLAWRDTGAPAAMRVAALTTLEGYEMAPTLSPDGTQVAFAWNGDGTAGNVDIYVSVIGSATVHRVTSDPAMDLFPRWSPDGRYLAFVRQWTDHAGRVYVTSPVGGPERKVSDFDAHFDRVAQFGQLSWSPDGRSIAAARSSTQPKGESTGIYLIPLSGGEPRLLTRARAPASDRDPAISADGRRLAYFSCANCCWGGCDVMMLDLDTRLEPRGTARRLTASGGAQMDGLTWSPTGHSLLYTQVNGAVNSLWRVNVDGRTGAERLEIAGLDARQPVTVPSRYRLVFGRSRHNSDIYSVEASGPPRAVSVSSLRDNSPAYSPDGRHVAFCSARSGDALRIWVAAADGSNARPLTGEMGDDQWAPAWSPNGRVIAFVAAADQHKQIWTVDLEGGNLRQVTSGAADRGWPSWSRDGTALYFGKSTGGQSDIWRIPVAGGAEQQVTHQGGIRGFETADGKGLIVQKAIDRAGSPLSIVPLAGGAPRRIVDCAYGFWVGGNGVYYYPCVPGGPPVVLDSTRSSPVRLMEPDSGRDRLIATLPDLEYSQVFWGPRVSPDGKTIVYGRLVDHGQDLMMIENFR